MANYSFDVNLISIILPTYNEVENIGRLIDQIIECCHDFSLELVVVDDNSPDGTARLIEDKAKRDERIKLICRRDKRGLTSAIQDGIDFSRGAIIVWLDTDLSMPAEIIPELLKKITEEDFDVAVGSRFVKGGGFKGINVEDEHLALIEIYRNIQESNDSVLATILSLMLNYFIRFTLDRSFKDYTSGFIAIKKPILEKIPLRGDYGEYFIDLIYRCLMMGYSVVELPYVCLPRKYGESKTGSNLFDFLRRGIKYFWVTLSLRFSRIDSNK